MEAINLRSESTLSSEFIGLSSSGLYCTVYSVHYLRTHFRAHYPGSSDCIHTILISAKIVFGAANLNISVIFKDHWDHGYLLF